MVNAVMDKTAHVQLVAAAQTIGIKIMLSGMIFFLMTGSNVSDLALSTTNGIDPSVAFQNAEDNHFSCRTATTSALERRPPKSLSSGSTGPQKPHRQPRPNDG